VADPSPPTASVPVPTPAATVVPVRDGPAGLEVLLLRRNSRGAFGGMWVFPGGQIDQSDRAGGGEEIDGARRAAVREAKEEADLDLEEAALVALSFWLPPPEAPRRFATWFFLAPVAGGGGVEVDQVEIREHRWLAPSAAMAARNAGDIELAPPTFTTLWWLSRHDDVASAMSAAASRPPEQFHTHIAAGADRRILASLWAGDAGYEDSDIERPGPRRRLVMDPSGWRVEIDLERPR
jgi:8-oxo-dGTP pyrophosphatase MutT (NUDIX family)